MAKMQHTGLKFFIMLTLIALVALFVLILWINNLRSEVNLSAAERAEKARAEKAMRDMQLAFVHRREEMIRSAIYQPTEEIIERTTTATTIPGKVIEVQEVVQVETTTKSDKKTKTS